MRRTAADFRNWELPDRLIFEDGPGGLVRMVITSPVATAVIYLHGAHITHFQPVDEPPALFLSGASAYAADKPIRGGAPVIFPWFGARAGHPEAPAHGFARTSEWEIETINSAGDETVIVLLLAAGEETHRFWPHDFIVRHRITIGAELGMELEVENSGAEPFTFEEALHTYLAISDVRHVSVSGLAGTEFLDKMDDLARKPQDSAPIRITGETDRIYLNTAAACEVTDLQTSRRIAVEKSGSRNTVVWNPWIAKAQAMSDFGDDEWSRMICIETANIGEDAVTLAPGAKHVMRAVITAQ
jgi:glucose-6-phosphate 1-epimerase